MGEEENNEGRSPSYPFKKDAVFSLKSWLEDQERQFLASAMAGPLGVCKSHAAAMLGLNRTTLVMKLKKYGLLTKPDKEREL